MRRNRPALWAGHISKRILSSSVRWYLRYPLSFRQLEKIMVERNLSVDNMIWRWFRGMRRN
jgi:transposase-like protein